MNLIGIGNNFMSGTRITQQLRKRTEKWGFMKLKSLCTTKKTVTRQKRQPTASEKIFATYTYDKGLRFHLIPVRTAIINNTNNKCCRGCGNCWWECQLVRLLWKAIMEVPQKTENRATIRSRDTTLRNISERYVL
jgi:isopenicillin N synthase-like dioxygenase